MEKTVQIVTSSIAVVCSFLWGQADGLLYALIAFIALDYLTGVIVAVVQHTLSSEVGFKGIAKKVLILALVAVGHILDTHVLGGGMVCRSAVIGFYLANEGISILENAARLGLPLPQKLTDVLEQLKSKED